ncbi:DUF4239 domain-containing protein [Thetidibacter halocola]|uniref:DUF4239 domain-containing protein n=1 Tax=Thetidibacter halocola TaxID=2827239 RepID=A0A8J8B5G7_9RHOB|nr:DUF4239 domain-containing protein [Thetidibacter halocola]MBS0122926.1 DUF4239 domain-containing protein [Thetidibacter halocola]
MPPVLLAPAFILGTAALALAVYFLTRRIVGQEFGDQTETLAGSVIFRVSALHGLILALVFAQELLDYNKLQGNLVLEATAVADIYNDIRRYDPDQAPAIQAALSAYVREVIDEEWRALSEVRRLESEGWRLREVVYLGVLDLVPQTPRQEALRHHMLDKAQRIAEFRQDRENTALHRISPLFWTAALAGIVLVTVPYFIFAPSRLHVALLSVYGGFTGLIMYVIFAFSDPFGGPGALQPVAFERLAEQGIGAPG